MSLRIKALMLLGTFALATAAMLTHGIGNEADAGWAATLAFLPCIFVLIDLIDAVVRVSARRRLAQGAGFSQTGVPGGNLSASLRAAPHAFIYAVRNLEHSVDDFLARREGQRESTWIVDLGSDDHTVLRIRAAGWRCFEIAGRTSGRGAIERLMRELPPSIQSIVLLDAASELATATLDPAQFERCLRDFQRSGAAAMVPRVSITGEQLVDRMLHLEAVLDFGLTRCALGGFASIESCTIFRRDALQLLLAGDVSVSQVPALDDTLVALARGERVYCEPRLEVRSAAPATFGDGFRARVAEWRGTALAFWQRRGEIDALAKRSPLALYHYVFHKGLLHIFATPLRVLSVLVVLASFANALDELAGGSLVPDGIVTHPMVFAAVYLKYLALHVFMITSAAPRREWPALLALAPLYFFHAQLRCLPALIGLLGGGKLRGPVSQPATPVHA